MLRSSSKRVRDDNSEAGHPSRFWAAKHRKNWHREANCGGWRKIACKLRTVQKPHGHGSQHYSTLMYE